MHQRTLVKNEVLWWQGDLAQSIALVDSGKLGIRTEAGLVAIALPGTVVGETAIFAVDSSPIRRKAAVYALEDATAITEFPVEMVKETFGVGVPRKILRTLLAQVCSSALVIIGANPGNKLVETAMRSLIRGLAECEEQVQYVKDWASFMVAFRMLFHLREGSDVMREALGAGHGLTEAGALRISATTKALFKAPDAAQFVQQFVEAERMRDRALERSGQSGA